MPQFDEVERNKNIICQLPGLLTHLDPSKMKAMFTEDFRLHVSARPDWPTGHEGARQLLVMMKSMMPDMTMSIEDMFGEADKVCVRWRYKGTVTGSFEGRRGDGARYEAIAFAIYRFRDGRIAEDWGTEDRLAFDHPWRTV